jgi:CDP-glucose 4,6-dehydratase
MEKMELNQKNKVDSLFWSGRRVFITGHTGFKGAWLSFWLHSMGAKVGGYSLTPSEEPNLYSILQVESLIERSFFADIRKLGDLKAALIDFQPDILIHMAAQSLVRTSYIDPIDTFSTNVMGTVNILEAIRDINSVRAALIVTSDKCYENREWIWGYRESDSMGGFDPYSSSKGCAELVTAAYRQSFFSNPGNLAFCKHIASARAGNVIGGGDWSVDRLIPDAIRAFIANEPLILRNPGSTRPWQHVLEPLSGYLMLAQELYKNRNEFATSWNFGPGDGGTCSVKNAVDILAHEMGCPMHLIRIEGSDMHEAEKLKLDCSKAKMYLGWEPRWDLVSTIQATAEWYRGFLSKKNMIDVTLNQIGRFMIGQ